LCPYLGQLLAQPGAQLLMTGALGELELQPLAAD
jgi:hypothetical protein